MEQIFCLRIAAEHCRGDTGSPPQAGPAEPQGPETRHGRRDGRPPWQVMCEDEQPSARLSVRASSLVTSLLSAVFWYALWTGGQALLYAI